MPISIATLLGKLRLHKPDYVLVDTSDADEPTRINMSKARQRAQRMLNALDEMQWQVVTLYDKGGGFLAKHVRGPEDEPPEGQIEELGVSPAAAKRLEVDHMLDKTFKFAAECMREQRIASQPLVDGLVRVIEVTGAHLTSEREANAAQKAENAKLHEQFLKNLYQTAAERAAAAAANANAGGDGSDIDSEIIRMIPAALEAMKGGAASPASSSASQSPKVAPRVPRRRAQQAQ